MSVFSKKNIAASASSVVILPRLLAMVQGPFVLHEWLRIRTNENYDPAFNLVFRGKVAISQLNH